MPLRVKFLSKAASINPTEALVSYLPNGEHRVGEVEWIFAKDNSAYDWLVVYDDLPLAPGGGNSKWEEKLACPRRNTLLITAEPSTIKVYGAAFLAQFGHVLTSQEPWAIPHPSPLFSQCGMIWFYGKSHQQSRANFPTQKTRELSTVCSAKQQKHTLHFLRHEFTRRLKIEMPDMEIFGHGHRHITTKIEALDPFRYHLAIENHHAPHHWTEKLADTFLGGCLPFYFGCPNVFDYFPEESLIPLDIRDFSASLETIRQALRDQAYAKRLPAIREARRLVLEEYALFPMLSRLIPQLHQTTPKSRRTEIIQSRHAWRRKHPIQTLAYGLERMRISWRSRRLKDGFLKMKI
ncbi:MAG: glycosyltransferase [Verrucomicrobiota bacterium]